MLELGWRQLESCQCLLEETEADGTGSEIEE